MSKIIDKIEKEQRDILINSMSEEELSECLARMFLRTLREVWEE